MRPQFQLSLPTSLLAVLWASGVAEGGLSYVSQARTVIANGFPSYRQADAPDFGPFNADVQTHDVTDIGDHHDVRASQSSRLGENFIRASGALSADSNNDTIGYRTLVDVTFDLAASTPYTLSSSLNFTDFHPDGQTPQQGSLYTLQLRQAGLGGGVLVDEQFYQFELKFNPFRSVSRAGTLSAGRYELLLDIKSEFLEDREKGGTYSLNFTTGSGGGPSAVPLPPAVWGGLLMMGAIVAARAWSAKTRVPCN